MSNPGEEQGLPAQHTNGAEPQIPSEHYINVVYSWRSWVFTLDHKRIAILFLVAITFMFFIGGLAALTVRLYLLSPEAALVRPPTSTPTFSIRAEVTRFFFLVAFF